MATYTQADIDRALSAKGTGNYTPEQQAAATALLQKGDALGNQSSQQTGVAYAPQYTSYTPAPSVPQSINSSSLQSQPPLAIPPTNNAPPPPTPPPPQAIDFGVDKAQQDFDSLSGQIEHAFQQQGTYTQRQQEMETAAGIPNLQKQLSELYNIDAGFVADLSNIASQNLQSQVRSEDRLAPTFAIYGEQAQAQRQAIFQQQNVNIKRATNAALITAAQGNLSQAQDYIQRALDAEFKPLESKIEYLKTFLSINAQRLDNAQQAQLQHQITLNERAYQEGVQNKNNIYTIMLEAQKNGADNLTLQRIQQAKTPEDALMAAGKYLATPAAPNELQFISGTDNQRSGYFNKVTGEFTPLGGGGGGAAGTTASPYTQERITRMTTDIQEVYQMINPQTAGLVGSQLARVPGTAAYNLKNKLDTIKANIGFNELQQMREASKTGGALGQIAVQELQYLQAVLGSLDQGQSPEQLKQNLLGIQESVKRWNGAQASLTQGGAQSTVSPEETKDLEFDSSNSGSTGIYGKVKNFFSGFFGN